MYRTIRSQVWEPNESTTKFFRLLVDGGQVRTPSKWPIRGESASLWREASTGLLRPERRVDAYSTLRPPTFSGDSLASAVWLTLRPNDVTKLQDVILKAMAKKLSWPIQHQRHRFRLCSGLVGRLGRSPAPTSFR